MDTLSDGDVSRRTVGAMLSAGALSSLTPLKASAAGSEIKLVSFNGEAGTQHRFQFEADPVMTGTSYGSSSIDDGKLVLKGYCSYRPFLTQKKEESSAYIKTETTDQKFPDVSSCEGISFVARSIDKPFPGYKFCIGVSTLRSRPTWMSTIDIGGNRAGTTKGKINKRSRLANQCYKAPFKAPSGNFETVQIPFKDFTNFWDAETGDTVRSCKDSPDGVNCPDAATLADMKDMSIWADGEMGDVNLQIKEISAYGCGSPAALSAPDEFSSSSFVCRWSVAASLAGLLASIVVRRRTRSTPITPALLG
jgi:hypothetical protein